MTTRAMDKVITILLVDDHALLRETLRTRLDAEEDLRVVGTANQADHAVDKVSQYRPDVVLMDIDMPGKSCFAAAQEIKRTSPDTSIVFLSAFFHDRYIDSALEAQASGYLTKDESPTTIIDAIRATSSGVAYFSPKVQSRILIDSRGARLADAGQSRASALTARELEVLRYVARGLPKKEIAVTMNLSVKTVSRHVENLMNKLQIHDRVELTRFAIREGLAEA